MLRRETEAGGSPPLGKAWSTWFHVSYGQGEPTEREKEKEKKKERQRDREATLISLPGLNTPKRISYFRAYCTRG